VGTGCGRTPLIWGKSEAKYFRGRDWTDEIALRSFGNFDFARSAAFGSNHQLQRYNQYPSRRRERSEAIQNHAKAGIGSRDPLARNDSFVDFRV
jgi:hypothetical protein